MSCEFAHLDGAYVLGSLTPAERIAFERHLPGCDACSRSVRELAGLPGLLAQVDLSDIEDVPVPPVPETLLPALVSGARREQRRRSVLVAAVAAGVGALAAGSLAVAVGLAGGGDPVAGPAPTATATPTTTASSTPALPMEAVGDTSVRADLVLAGVAWGTRVDMTCSYGRDEDAYGPSEGARYALVVRTLDGRTEQVATWKGLPGRTMRVSGATATDRRDIERVELRTADGLVLLQLTI